MGKIPYVPSYYDDKSVSCQRTSRETRNYFFRSQHPIHRYSWPLVRGLAAVCSIYPPLTGSFSFSRSWVLLSCSHVFPVHGSHCPVKPYFRPLLHHFNELIAIKTHRVIHVSHFYGTDWDRLSLCVLFSWNVARINNRRHAAFHGRMINLKLIVRRYFFDLFASYFTWQKVDRRFNRDEREDFIGRGWTMRKMVKSEQKSTKKWWNERSVLKVLG